MESKAEQEKTDIDELVSLVTMYSKHSILFHHIYHYVMGSPFEERTPALFEPTLSHQ